MRGTRRLDTQASQFDSSTGQGSDELGACILTCRLCKRREKRMRGACSWGLAVICLRAYSGRLSDTNSPNTLGDEVPAYATC